MVGGAPCETVNSTVHKLNPLCGSGGFLMVALQVRLHFSRGLDVPVQVREIGTGKSRLEVARELGINFELLPGISIRDGIDAGKRLDKRSVKTGSPIRQRVR